VFWGTTEARAQVTPILPLQIVHLLLDVHNQNTPRGVGNHGLHLHTPGRASLGGAAPQEEAHAPPPGAAMQASLLLVLHVTPIGGVLTDKKGLEGRLNLLPKDCALLIGLHGLERVP
jgi:hypothetical protein